jgi:hypothetical protein
MGTSIAVQTAFSGKELCRLASRVKNAGEACRLLAIATVLDGASRRHGSWDARDWVMQINRQGPAGLINK